MSYLSWSHEQMELVLYDGVTLVDLCEGNIIRVSLSQQYLILFYWRILDERGLQASADIPEKSVIASLPLTSIMTIDYCTHVPRLSSLLSSGLREDDVLSLLLLHEKHIARESSKFHRHILLLPNVREKFWNYFCHTWITNCLTSSLFLRHITVFQTTLWSN